MGFIILRLGDSLTSFTQDNSANCFGEKDVQMKPFGVSIIWEYAKKL